MCQKRKLTLKTAAVKPSAAFSCYCRASRILATSKLPKRTRRPLPNTGAKKSLSEALNNLIHPSACDLNEPTDAGASALHQDQIL